ncbi:MAG: mechanosensitive ion channel family protein [Methanomassiliicoccales archaeon]|nr:mechanosensitive ion channel family protein [Methanomassiliicoccales archaeon]
MLRKWRYIWSLMVIALLLVSFSSALQASPEDATIYQVDEQKAMDTGSTASFQWVVYNNGSDPLLLTVELETGLPSRMSYVLEPAFLVLEPGRGQDVFLNVTADADMYSDDLYLQVLFNVTDMVTDVSEESDYSVALEVNSIYGHLDRQNKIMGTWDNFLPAPFDGSWGAFLVSLLIWLAIAFLIMEVFGPALHALTKRTALEWDDIIIDVLKQPIFLLILAYGTISSLEILSLSSELMADMELLYLVVLVLVGALLAYRLLVKVVVRYARERSKTTETEADDILVGAMEMLGKVLVPVVTIFVIAAIFGLDLGSAIIGLGFLGLIVGYATQAWLSNVFAGIQLLFDRPIKIGDQVPLEGGHIAHVQHIGLQTCHFLDLDTNEAVVIPNSLLMSKVIVNMSAPDVRYIVDVKVKVPVGEDPKRIEALMLEAARLVPQILQEGKSAPVVRVSDLKDGRILFTIFLWVDRVQNRYLARTEYRTNLYRLFNESKVEFALPRKTVWFGRN